MSINNLNTYLNIKDSHLRVVSGNVYAQAMNIGGINVETAHGLQSVSNTGNVTSNTLQFSNAITGFVTTANAQIGRDLIVSGNTTVSTDLTVSANATVADTLTISEHLIASKEATITGNLHVTTIRSDSNVVTEYTGPHDRPLRKYPEVAMTANDNSSTSGYVASRSSVSGSYDAWNTFSAYTSNANRWQSTGNTYDSSGNWVSGVGATGVQFTDTASGQHSGEWIKIQLPKSIKLDYIRYLCNYTTFMTKDFVILGSNDDTSWTLLKSVTGGTSIEDVYHTLHINAGGYYKYYVWLTTAINGNSGEVVFNDICFYGHEEGSGSLDTTLKSVYNVPATTGTQLEVYYDAKGLDNGNAPTNPVDLSPNTNNATLGGDPQVSNGAFVFDGTGDYITGTHGLSVPGQPVHSQCVWFKITGDTSDYQYISIIGTSNPTNQAGLVLLNDGTTLLGNYYGGERVITTITQNVWYHAVLVYTGTTTDAAKYYINGVEVITTGLSGAAPITPTITGTTVRLGANTSGGQELNGSIANFRLYSKALNADQVKELYDYQKDYFLGSKSQVTLYKGHLGVGVTEPSGQLELAGDERIQEYPPRALRQYTTHVEGHGVFTVRASAELNQTGDNDRAWKMFTKIADDSNYWTPTGGTTTYGYSSSDGYTTAYHETAGVKGHWVQLQLPYKIKLHSVKIAAGISTRQAKDATVFGSNDGGNTWTSVGGWTDNNVGDFTLVTFSMNNVGYYSLYRLVITRNGGNDAITLSELQFFGTPGPTTLDKGSLTLGRSLDVPRVSRYDVDTETPRPEKLVVDYDTTVNSSPTDISGKGNHGVFKNDSEYSPADKAFKFDGDNDYIQTGSGSNVISGSAPPFTASVWVNNNSSDSTYASVFSIEPDTYGTNTNVWFYILSGKPTLQFENNYVEFYEPGTSTGGATRNIWHHLVVSYNGNSTIGGRRCWLNGVEQTSSAVAGSGNLTLGTTRLTLGVLYYGNNHVNDMTGKISNFKLYNVALEPSEVQKLYRLGRTGRSMVISDTAVGIGKVPEAQLDVRGNLRVDGDILASVPYYAARQRAINSQATNRGIVYDAYVYTNYPGSFVRNSNTDGYYQPPRNGMYQVYMECIASGSGNVNIQRRTGTTVNINHCDRHWNYSQGGWDSVSASALIPITDCTTQNIRIYVNTGIVWSYDTYHGSAYFKWFSEIPERRQHHVT